MRNCKWCVQARVECPLYVFKGLTGFDTNGVFLKRIRTSVNSGNLINHLSMNWAQFKDSLCYPCLAGAAIACYSLTQEVAGLNKLFKIIIFFDTELAEFSKNI